jgi:pseudouridine-5'-monophosphatase
MQSEGSVRSVRCRFTCYTLLKGISMPHTITHVIFDMDGLLLNTEPFYTEAHEIMASRYGKVFDWSVKSRMIGLPAQTSAQRMIDALQLPISVAEYLEMRAPILEKLFPRAEPMPGAVSLTHRLHDLGIPQAVATSSTTHHFHLKTSRHSDWFGLFKLVVTGDDPAVKRGKPNPDIFLHVAENLSAVPENCLVFEDSPAGIEAASAAGMHSVAVPDPHMSDGEYSKADQIIRSLVDFDLSFWGLPS